METELERKIEEYKRLMDGGKSVSGSAVTETYNEVFAPRKLAPTNCSTCVKRRITELYKHLLNERKKEQEQEDTSVVVADI